MTRDAAERLYALTGRTVDQRLQDIADTAHAVLGSLEGTTCPHKPAAINRWAVDQLKGCSQVFCRPPPTALVTLIERQLGVDRLPRAGRKNTAKFVAAAKHLARNPDSTPGMIARAIHYDQKAQIKTWLEDPRFQEYVETERIVIQAATEIRKTREG